MLKKIILTIILINTLQAQDYKILNNGMHEIKDKKLNQFKFYMKEKGFINIDTNYNHCIIELFNNNGKILETISMREEPKINKEIEKGEYYINAKRNNKWCRNFTIFSPKLQRYKITKKINNKIKIESD